MAQATASGHSTAASDTWRRRENLLPGAILLLLATVAWAYTLYQARSTGGAPMAGEMGDMQMAQVNRLADISLFLLGWGAMMVAMMIPAAMPVILLYRTVARKRMTLGQAGLGLAVLVVGYLGVWIAAGLPVYAYSLLSERAGALMSVLPGVLLIAGGAYQFTALKHGCHSRCSNPLMFLMQHYRPGLTGALRMGALHGIDCLGCCVGLMVGLVALGMMNIALMLTAAVIIFVEKTLPWGHRVARPLGVAMAAGGVVLVAVSPYGTGQMM